MIVLCQTQLVLDTAPIDPPQGKVEPVSEAGGSSRKMYLRKDKNGKERNIRGNTKVR